MIGLKVARVRRRTEPARGRETLVVVGNGMVGHRLCTTLVELGATSTRDVVVFGEEPLPAYDRVHLTDLLSGRDEDSLLLSPRAWYDEHGIDLRLNDPVVRIERAGQAVVTASGTRVGYDRLVLATGSAPFVPLIVGADLNGVFVYRTISDLQAIRGYARAGFRTAVIGGGLLGLEAARALRDIGLAVTVIEFSAGLMPSQLDQTGSQALEREIRSHGISVLTGTQTKRIEADGPLRTIYFAGDRTLSVEMVVIAAGIRPRGELAAASGLEVTPVGGVIVDRELKTSDPRIYAIGECASRRSRTYGLVAPGYRMADALATNLAGGSATFEGAITTARLKVLDVEVASSGHVLDGGPAITYQAPGVYRVLRIDRGRLAGALGVGSWSEFARIHDAVGRRRIWPWEIARFQETGFLRVGEAAVSEWADDAIVCNCMGITKGRLTTLFSREGATTVESLARRTGASTLCGSCKPLLVELTCNGGGEEAGAARANTGLLVGSAIALLAGFGILVAAPVPFASSVQDSSWLDTLWRDGSYRRISGFTLLGISLFAVLISLRKRWRRLSVGSFPLWRMLHVMAGVLALLALVVHTGFRPGANLNLALMTSFLVVNVVGSIAGGMTALEAKLPRRGGRTLRRVLVFVHALATWPLPILIAFHVLAVYYF